MADRKTYITVRVGRAPPKKFAADEKSNTGTDYLVNALAEEALIVTQRGMVANLKKLRERLHKAVRSELTMAMKYAIGNMIGIQSPQTGSSLIFNLLQQSNNVVLSPSLRMRRIKRPSGNVRWQALSSNTVRRKFGSREEHTRSNARNFYVASGRLRNWLRDHTAALVEGTGVVSVDFKAEKTLIKKGKPIPDEVPIADLTLRFMPRIPATMMPGLAAGNLSAFDPNLAFERRLGISGRNWEKLRGKTGWSAPDEGTGRRTRVPIKTGGQIRTEFHRPLLQPVFTYWTMFRMPRRIASVLTRNIFAPERGGV